MNKHFDTPRTIV